MRDPRLLLSSRRTMSFMSSGRPLAAKVAVRQGSFELPFGFGGEGTQRLAETSSPGPRFGIVLLLPKGDAIFFAEGGLMRSWISSGSARWLCLYHAAFILLYWLFPIEFGRGGPFWVGIGTTGLWMIWFGAPIVCLPEVRTQWLLSLGLGALLILGVSPFVYTSLVWRANGFAS